MSVGLINVLLAFQGNSMAELSRTGDKQKPWYPRPIGQLVPILQKALYSERGYEHVYALTRNIAYNLQYIEFQDQIIQEIKLSSVIRTQTIKTFKGNQKKLDGEIVRVDTVIYKKLPEEQLKHMSFDAMIKCAKSKSVFGSNKEIYITLESLRTLRNKVHLQVINNPYDTDWNTFNTSDLSDICKVLYAIFTSSLFEVTEKEEQCFRYLRRNFDA